MMNEGARHDRDAGRLRGIAAGFVAAWLAAAGAPAHAQSSSSGAGAWTFELTPYLWASGLKGDVQAGAVPRTSVDMKFTDIFDILDFAAMGTLEARNGRWGLLFDAIYLKVSDEGTATRTGPGPIGATLTATADAEAKQTLLSAAAMYRVSEGRTAVDALGGVRYTKIKVSADIGASLFGPAGAGVARTVSRSGDKDWTEPFVGARILHPVSDRWTLVGYADVGGFGVGSDLTWQVIGGANYESSKRLSFKFGYRYMRIDYDKSGALYDVTMQGPYAGLGISF
jgi:opacity protein-like surface antigen